ncbi:uncharacterized mitochondrial protein AtMg00810-like [Arachis duranensis]|uniref:Uncharacterized mitochondrial protein AtMg00810-like n=1 Tax=Arachis duranensis TaxID=130453 RepID=A0A9C6WQ02_ARADU|nr:uncharacterized mitochondrial protein AtMg00810-like [Arachis duranensis]
MKDELNALELNKIWRLVDCPTGVKPVGYKWVYRIKRKPDGLVDRYKTRLVAKGFTQTEGVDFLKTFSPVVKSATIRLVLALASMKRWPIHQLDVNNTFLHGDLFEDIYMTLPPRFTSHQPNQCFYVDDIVLTGNSISELAAIKSILHQHFQIKDLGPLKYFLGIEVAQSEKGICLSQRKYCLDLLEDSGLLGAKPASVPMDSTTRLYQDKSFLLSDPFVYRRLVGHLIYLTTTRPDIMYATQQLSQFMASPTESHLQVAKHVLRYVKTSPGKGLFFPRESEIQLLGFSDSDWAGCPDTRRSLTGYCFFLGSSLVSWKTKKQTTVARSSTEAEYRALANTTCKLQWILNVLQFLRISPIRPPVLYCDN